MSPVHALIIDDDGYNVEILARLLESEGASSTAVQDPLQVENTLSDLRSIDVVFLDLEMPKVDGYQVFDTLEALLDPAIPIVAYSVHANEIDVARDLGFHGFLGKPLDAGLFPDQLDRILAGEPVWEP